MPLNELALFAGAGGGLLASDLLGWRTVCAVEIDPYCASLLCARQNDGILPPYPIWDDVRTFDGRPWRGIVDIISGGVPCQDISVAGKGAGINGAKSGLWREMARIIREVQPGFALLENSPALTNRGLHVVLGDLAEAGYDAAWCVLGANDVGAPHYRKRIWILAHTHGKGQLQQKGGQRHQWHRFGDSRQNAADSHCQQQQKQRRPVPTKAQKQVLGCNSWWAAEPNLGRVAHGVAARVDRLKALGNGQVPAVAAVAFTHLISTF